MAIKWKKRAGLSPQLILNKIEGAKTIGQDGRVSYSTFEYHEVFASIFSLLEIPKAISTELDLDALVSKALGSAARAGAITEASLIKQLNEIASSELATRESPYHLLTSLSMDKTLPFRRVAFNGSTIRALEGPYPKKYSTRNEVVKHVGGEFSGDHPGYMKIIVSIKAKSTYGAASKALNSLDVIRALIALFSNLSMEYLGSLNSPINKVRTGQVHTLHTKSGAAAVKTLWFEPNFVKSRPFNHQNPKLLKQNFDWALERLEESKYSDTLVEALNLYVRALDEKDHNSAALRLWGALECLASPKEAVYDRIVKRCAFLFKEHDYHRQILEHLREFRNRSIHSGHQSEKAKTYCYQMQFYFRELILYHFRASIASLSFDEANDFLDLPADETELKRQKDLIERAVKFRGI